MSFKDDFLEALRSVKRDIMGSEIQSDINAPQQPDMDEDMPSLFKEAQPEPSASVAYNDSAPPSDGVEIFQNEAVAAEESDTAYSTYSAEPAATAPPPFVPEPTPANNNNNNGGGYNSANGRSNGNSFYSGGSYNNDSYNTQEARQIFDFDASELYSDEKTVISKNTVIRGNLQTNDPMRMMGQVLGDIECRSNIVIAGKMRGNTAATNAYVLDAVIDGDMLCDDSINVNENAWIRGNIRAQQVEVGGKIKGNLEIRHAVRIGPTSSIIGDISCDEIGVTPGAFINGNIIMYSPSRDVIDKFENFES